jgi:hypothetical protein
VDSRWINDDNDCWCLAAGDDDCASRGRRRPRSTPGKRASLSRFSTHDQHKQQLTHSLTHLLTYSLTHSLTHLLSHSPSNSSCTHSLAHHSLTLPIATSSSFFTPSGLGAGDSGSTDTRFVVLFTAHPQLVASFTAHPTHGTWVRMWRAR